MAIKHFTRASILIIVSVSLGVADLSKAYDMPEASELIENDLFPGPTKYTMPKSCNLKDAASIARGKYIYHNLNGAVSKEQPPEGLVQFIEKKDKDGKLVKVAKQYGNCVACHDIEEAQGAGNIGPSLKNYKALFIDSKIRNAAFVYQKTADPRVDNPDTHMTVNLTTKLMSPQEICDLTAYIIQDKSNNNQG